MYFSSRVLTKIHQSSSWAISAMSSMISVWIVLPVLSGRRTDRDGRRALGRLARSPRRSAATPLITRRAGATAGAIRHSATNDLATAAKQKDQEYRGYLKRQFEKAWQQYCDLAGTPSHPSKASRLRRG